MAKLSNIELVMITIIFYQEEEAEQKLMIEWVHKVWKKKDVKESSLRRILASEGMENVTVKDLNEYHEVIRRWRKGRNKI